MSPKLEPKTKNSKKKEAAQVQQVAKSTAESEGVEEAEQPEEPQEEADEPEDRSFGLEAGGGILLTAKANSLSDIIRRLCVPTAGKDALVNPLPLRVKEQRIETAANSRFKGLAVFGGFPIDHEGEGELCIDPVELRSFLDLYGDQHVAIHFDDGGLVTIQGERRTSRLYALGEKPPFYTPSFKEQEDGHVTFKNGSPTEWVASLKAKDLSEAASPSNLLGVKTWSLTCDDTGITVGIGSVEGKGRTVRTRVPVQFGEAEIKNCGSEFGEDFGTLMNIIDGDIELATGGDVPDGNRKMPAVIRNGPVTYTVMPRKNQAE